MVLAPAGCGPSSLKESGSAAEKLVSGTLESVLDAPDATEFSERLSAFGPVDVASIPALEIVALGDDDVRAVNAVRLLSVARSLDARAAALERIARKTTDVAVWAVAIDVLAVDAPGAMASVSRARPDMGERALADTGTTLRGGLRALAVAEPARFMALARSRMADGDPAMRRTTLLSLSPYAARGLTPELRARLRDEPVVDVAALVASLLAHSDDAAVQREVTDYFWAGNAERRNALSDVFRDHQASWLRSYWMGVAREGGERQDRALRILAPSAGPELLPICVSLYESAPARGSPGYVDAALAQSPCDLLVSRLAGRELRGAAALAYAREHAPAAPSDGI